ncbi:MAG: SIS domain-containing protein [Breznakia sp.]
MILNKEVKTWEELDGIFTASEIKQQPDTWRKTLVQMEKQKEEISAFIKQITSCDDYDIIFTGAGTSEFVGNSIFSYLAKTHNYKTKSYGTTDIVAAPENYLSKTKPTLLVSFARSGNSPESVAAVESANVVCDNVKHLFITCNPEGALSKFAKNQTNCYAINLTPETNDNGFAMTSSFSNMYLAAVLAFTLDCFAQMKTAVEEVIRVSERSMAVVTTTIAEMINEFAFERIVYLGSNTNKGIAQESALKILELTAGKVVSMYDSPMGFRHGPKSIVDEKTLTVVYLSDNEFTRQYEKDIIKEMRHDQVGKLLVITTREDEVSALADYKIIFKNKDKLENVLLGLEYIVAAQIISLYASLSVKNTPDHPSKSGTVNRVVQGVIIYPYKK